MGILPIPCCGSFTLPVSCNCSGRRLSSSADATLAAIAAKAVKEAEYHRRHCAQWVIRLGDGTDESARRMAEAVALLAPYTGEFFIADQASATLLRAVYCQTLKRCSPHGKRMLSRYSRRPGSFRRQMSMRKRGAAGSAYRSHGPSFGAAAIYAA